MSSVLEKTISSLKKIAPGGAELTNVLLRLLTQVENSHAVNTTLVDAISDTNAHMDAPVFVVNEHCAFAVFGHSDADTPSSKNFATFGTLQDIDDALNMLDMADSILNHIEKCLSITLDPKFIAERGQSAFVDKGAVILVLKSGVLSVQLALMANAEQRIKWTNAATGLCPDGRNIPCSIIIECCAARLPLKDAAQIETGDMLLLPSKVQATWHLQTDNTAKARRNGILEITNASLRITNQIYDSEENDVTDGQDIPNVLESSDVPRENPSRSSEPHSRNGAHAFTVPVSIRLPALYYDAETLGALREGSSLSIVPLTQGLHVELLVGGRTFAHGEIVEIGDNFGVLITNKIHAAADYPQEDASRTHDTLHTNAQIEGE